jgi:inorganic pyrophosphatase
MLLDICGKMMAAMAEDRFWRKLDELVASCKLVIDRPRGSSHPRYRFSYPFDYGYLENTRAADGHGIDVWVGSLPEEKVTGIVCTLDLEKRDAEIKILLGCKPEEARRVLSIHNRDAQAGMLVERPCEDNS